MYHYNPQTALEELQEDVLLPTPANVRDMIIRTALKPQQALSLNRELQIYMHAFDEAHRTVQLILQELASANVLTN
jgi:hypothetical protein